MARFLITYDLKQPGRDYSSLYTAIRATGSGEWLHPLESVWILDVTAPIWISATIIRDALVAHIDANDEILVLNITGSDWATWMQLYKNDWLQIHMP